MTFWGEPERLHMNNVEQLHERLSVLNTDKRIAYITGRNCEFGLAEEVRSHTVNVDTAHWSSTPCTLQKM